MRKSCENADGKQQDVNKSRRMIIAKILKKIKISESYNHGIVSRK